MAEYKAGPKFVTDRGTFVWPFLNEPNTKHDKAGAYEVKIRLPDDSPCLDFIRKKGYPLIDAEIEKQLEANPKLLLPDAYDAKFKELMDAGKKGLAEKLKKITRVEPIQIEYDEETGDETGYVIFRAKMKASGVYKKGKKEGQRWERKPTIFDARGKALKNPPVIGGGTEGKLSLEIRPYWMAGEGKVGLSFALEAAQILKLVRFGSRDAADFGFGEEEGDEIEDQVENEGRKAGFSSDDDDDDDGIGGGADNDDDDL